MTREQSRANTRERLLAAARSVFARSGFHGASVEEIASEAGFSTGALYSNFDGKEDLFLALMEREIEEHARELAEAVRARASIAERATGGARQWMTMIEREPELLLLFMEFWAYGVRDPTVRPKVAARFAQMRQVLTRADRRRRARVRPRAGDPRRAARGRHRRARRRHRAPEAGRPRRGAGRADGARCSSLLFAAATRPAAGTGTRSGP